MHCHEKVEGKGQQIGETFSTKQIQTSRKELTQTNNQTKEYEKFHTTRTTLLQLAQYKSCHIFLSAQYFLFFKTCFLFSVQKLMSAAVLYRYERNFLINKNIYLYTPFLAYNKVVSFVKFARMERGLVKSYTHNNAKSSTRSKV